MPYEEGLSDWRVYSAEQSVGHDRPIEPDESQELVDGAVASDWFQEWFPHPAPIEVRVGGQDHPDVNMVSSYATPWGYPRPTRWLISMHPRMLTARVLLHELAHCVQPIYEATEGLRSERDQRYHWERRKHRSHGEYFTAALGVITDHMLPGDGGQLFAACRHYEAPIADQEALREQVLGQPKILDDEQQWYDGIRQRSAELEAKYEAEHGERRLSRVPDMSQMWGWHLKDYRRCFHRRVGGSLLSQRRMAEEISKVTPCTAKHISLLEDLRCPPEDPAQLKRAMLMTIYLGLDPIWVRYNMRLTRWDCGDITLKEARVMNPSWARLVSKMNKQLRERPAQWRVEGER